MVVVAVAAITRVAWGRVHAHATLAHLVSEELALVHVCGKDGQRRAPHQAREGRARVWGGRMGECVAPRLDQGREGPKGGDRDPEVERYGRVEVERQSGVGGGVGGTEKQGEKYR